MLRRELRCSVCGRMVLADAYAELGRTQEAIDLLLEEQASFDQSAVHPLNRIAATRELGPLLEAVGDLQAALEQYRIIVDAWGEGDPELQQAVQHAADRPPPSSPCGQIAPARTLQRAGVHPRHRCSRPRAPGRPRARLVKPLPSPDHQEATLPTSR